jgi:hypothetical protein
MRRKSLHITCRIINWSSSWNKVRVDGTQPFINIQIIQIDVATNLFHLNLFLLLLLHYNRNSRHESRHECCNHCDHPEDLAFL